MNIEYMRNFGALKAKIPESLRLNLLEESKKAENSNNTMESGLTYPTIPNHYYVKDCVEELGQFVFTLKEEYDKTYPGLDNAGTLTDPLPYYMTAPWFNFQKKGQFLPQHTHDGLYSFSLWLQIPYEYEEEKVTNKWNGDMLMCFEFTYLTMDGQFKFHNIPLSKKDEGTIIMFPSKLPHMAYPFYSTEGTRISVSGNIGFKVSK